MANVNLSDAAERKKIINQIKGAENQARKRNEQRKFDIYRKRQAPYVLERLQDEFDENTVKNMRKVLSINPCKRIVDEQASIYVEEPERHFAEGSDEQQEQLKEIYECGMINPQLRLANRYYKLHGQSCIYVLPKDGKIIARALTPKDYDVIPDADDPEKAFAYVLNVFDAELYKTAPGPASQSKSAPAYNYNNRLNEKIADQIDNKDALGRERYVFWTDEEHFTCDGNGELIDEVQPNPIGVLPFIDIANEKDFRFFVQLGSDVSEFVIDFLTQLSDLANTVRFQNYSQAIIYSVNQPKDIKVGPSKIIWLQVDPNADQGTRPEFQFVAPTPDIMGSLEFLNVQLKMFLSSVGLNPGTVSGHNEIEKFTSGIDHLLANIDKFKASKEDIDIFRRVEQQLFELIVKWQDIMFEVNDDTKLDDEFIQTRLSEDLTLDVSFHEPHSVQTQTEIEDSVIKLVKSGLMTKVDAIKKIYDVDDDAAEEMLEKLDEEKQANIDMGLGPDGQPLPPNPFTGEPQEPGKPGEPIAKGKPPFGKGKTPVMDKPQIGNEKVVGGKAAEKKKPKGKNPFAKGKAK